MDIEPLLEIVDALVSATSRLSRFGHLDDEDYDDVRDEALRMVGAARAIAGVVAGAPDPSEFEKPETGWNMSDLHDAAVRLQGLLQVRTKLNEALRSVGPVLSVEAFHEWVWTPAASLWRDGHRRNAIHAAASHIETQLQAKLGREDVSGVALVREAFSLKPPAPGKRRLRFEWLTEPSEAFTSRHEGAIAFGVGCFQLIRNSAAHHASKISEKVAIEHLACLSYLARLIDQAHVVGTAPEGPKDERPFG